MLVEGSDAHPEDAAPGLIGDPQLRAGMRIGVAYAVAAFVLAISFGILAEPVMGPVAPIVMSALMFAGSAQ
ncbi:MAG: hypothetical protein ACREME_12030, partial [Gemmatimonadales bacterium]